MKQQHPEDALNQFYPQQYTQPRSPYAKALKPNGLLHFTTLTFATILLLSLTSLSCAASFDCQRAQSATEKTICAVRSLNDADVKLATLYNFSLHALPMGSRDQQRDLQVGWLKQRNACGKHQACLAARYAERQAQIEQLLQQRVLSRGPF